MSSQVEYVCKRGGERLDRFLADRMDDASRSQIRRWIDGGLVLVNGQSTKASQRLQIGDVVSVTPPTDEPEGLQPWHTPLSIMYEDADCAVVDKPAGMVVHPATSQRQNTLVHALLARYPEMAAMIGPDTEAGRRPGIVHRLDKDTSGLIVVARHEEARAALQRQFRARTVDKVYVALLHGRLSPPEGQEGTIDLPIGRDPRSRQRMAVVEGGRRAITRYIVRRFLFTRHGVREAYTLVEARLVTGRTHQIRVHLAHIGHPVVGDKVYGRRKMHIACPRQCLHAFRLGFHRPSDGEWLVLEAPLPADLQHVLDQLTDVT
jgi:23S rRNA pseudouridine1911/1915/1917 synthase